MTIDAVNVQINISDKYFPRPDSNCVLILDEFASDSTDKLNTDIYFTSDGTSTGTELRVKAYTTFDALGKDFKSTSVVSKKAEVFFAQNGVRTVLVGRKDTTDAKITDALNAIKAENNNFIGLVSTYGALDDLQEAQNQTDVLEIADWAAANEKIYCFLTKDAACEGAGTSDILSQIKAKACDNAFGIYTNNYDETNKKFTAHQDAILAYGLTFRAGTTLFEDKTLNNVAVTSGLSTTALQNIEKKNGNLYIEDQGINVFKGNILGSGRFIDTKLFAMFLKREIQQNIRLLQINKSNAGQKIPYTDYGVDEFEAVLSMIFERELKLGTLTPFVKYVGGVSRVYRYIIDTIPVSQVPDAEKNARNYDYLNFEARYSSGIQEAEITGNLLV